MWVQDCMADGVGAPKQEFQYGFALPLQNQPTAERQGAFSESPISISTEWDIIAQHWWLHLPKCPATKTPSASQKTVSSTLPAYRMLLNFFQRTWRMFPLHECGLRFGRVMVDSHFIPLIIQKSKSLLYSLLTSTQWYIRVVNMRVHLQCRLLPIAIQHYFCMQCPDFFLDDFLKLIKQFDNCLKVLGNYVEKYKQRSLSFHMQFWLQLTGESYFPTLPRNIMEWLHYIFTKKIKNKGSIHT